MSTTSESDLQYLKVLENKPFQPIGWLYESVYDGLAARGLVVKKFDGYPLSETGREALVKESP